MPGCRGLPSGSKGGLANGLRPLGGLKKLSLKNGVPVIGLLITGVSVTLVLASVLVAGLEPPKFKLAAPPSLTKKLLPTPKEKLAFWFCPPARLTSIILTLTAT